MYMYPFLSLGVFGNAIFKVLVVNCKINIHNNYALLVESLSFPGR